MCAFSAMARDTSFGLSRPCRSILQQRLLQITYDMEKDHLDISDFYDFSSSYPDTVNQGKKAVREKQLRVNTTEDEDWEDMRMTGRRPTRLLRKEMCRRKMTSWTSWTAKSHTGTQILRLSCPQAHILAIAQCGATTSNLSPHLVPPMTPSLAQPSCGEIGRAHV